MSDSLPAHSQVVVIGGGIMGCSTLYHLAELGVREPLLLERKELTCGPISASLSAFFDPGGNRLRADP